MRGSFANLLSRARPPAPDRIPAIRPQPRAAVPAPPPPKAAPAEPEMPMAALVPAQTIARRRPSIDEVDVRKPPVPVAPADDEVPLPGPMLAPRPRAEMPVTHLPSLRRPAVRPHRMEPAASIEPPNNAAPREPSELDSERLLRPRVVTAEPVGPAAPAPARVEQTPVAPSALRPAVTARARAHTASEPAEAPHLSDSREPPSRGAGAERDTRTPSTQAAPPPTIHVHIGRVEVRAAVPPPASPPTSAAPAPRPGAALAEYLDKRWRGER